MKSVKGILLLGFSTILLFGVVYPVVIVGIGKVMPEKAKGLPIESNGKLVGFENIGQPFNGQGYFWGRPSAVGYNAAATGGSNKGPSNPDFLLLVQERIDTLLKYHPGKEAADIPVDMVTASGSGLDPHISLPAAVFQAERIAFVRHTGEKEILEIINRSTDSVVIGFIGPQDYVNALELNLQLDTEYPFQ